MSPSQNIKTISEKIFVNDKKLLELRRKQQAYSAINIILGLTSIFDFFSKDAFSLALESKYLAQKIQAKIVKSEMLLLAIASVSSNLAIKETLLKSNLNSKAIIDICLKDYDKKKRTIIVEKIEKNFFFLIRVWLEKFFFFNAHKKQQPKFSKICLFLFDLAGKNAQKRFHTPIITTDILFLTILEERGLKTGKALESIVSNPLEWLVLRYKLIKSIYFQELAVRNQLKNKHFYYLYLLKTQISEANYNYMLQNKNLEHKSLVLRAELIKKALCKNASMISNNLIFQRLNERVYCLN